MRRAFTLLEVMVALSILALAFTAIAGMDATSFAGTTYAKHVTIATLLARSKMIDVEEVLRKDGFSDSDKEDSGDFSEEGHPDFRWESNVRKTEVDVAKLVLGFLGDEGGDVATEDLPEQMKTLLGAVRGEGSESLVSSVGSSDLAKLAGGAGGGIVEAMFKQVSETLKNSIREITLEVSWGKEETDEEKIKIVQYVTTSGRLTMAPMERISGVKMPGDRNEDTIQTIDNQKGEKRK